MRPGDAARPDPTCRSHAGLRAEKSQLFTTTDGSCHESTVRRKRLLLWFGIAVAFHAALLLGFWLMPRCAQDGTFPDAWVLPVNSVSNARRTSGFSRCGTVPKASAGHGDRHPENKPIRRGPRFCSRTGPRGYQPRRRAASTPRKRPNGCAAKLNSDRLNSDRSDFG